MDPDDADRLADAELDVWGMNNDAKRIQGLVRWLRRGAW